MEKERKKLIESILFHKCLPITMEYFTGEHGVFSLNLCKTAIEESDAIILVLKDFYGSFVKREEVNACFPDGMPFKHPRKFSYTDFEYMYAKYLGKTIYVLIEKNKQISDPFQVSFIDSIKNSGFVSFFKDYNEFTSSSSIAINQILIECQKNNSLGLISAKRLEDFENLHNRICVLEDNANNGLAILQNYMGCLIYEDKLYFYVYKKMHLLRKKDRINFSIHMNSAESGFKGVLSVDYVKAKAYKWHQIFQFSLNEF